MSAWVVMVVGLFALAVVALAGLLLVGRFSSKTPEVPFEGPRPHPRGEAVPSTGSR